MGSEINQFKPVQQSRPQTIRAYCPKIYTVSKGHIQKKKKKKKASLVKQPSAITVIEVVRKPNGHYDDPPVSTESSESSSDSDSDSGRKSSTLKVS